MGILGKLFGSSKAMDGLYNGIDKAIYTEEEKAEAFQKLLKHYEPFKLAQRLLALTFCIPYMLAWLVTFIAVFFGIDVADQMDMLSGDIGKIVLAIVSFYFLGGTVNSLMSRKK